MIGESGGVTTLVYQEQVSRENQIQRDQGPAREIEEVNNNQVATDVASFSSEALELAQTAVSAVEVSQEVDIDQQSQEAGGAPANPEGGSSPAQYLDLRV